MQLQLKKTHSALFRVEAETVGELYGKAAQHYSIANIDQLLILYNNDILEFEKTFDFYGIKPDAVCVAIVADEAPENPYADVFEHVSDEEVQPVPPTQARDIEELISMGFARELAETSYAAAGGNMDIAIAMLLP